MSHPNAEPITARRNAAIRAAPARHEVTSELGSTLTKCLIVTPNPHGGPCPPTQPEKSAHELFSYTTNGEMRASSVGDGRSGLARTHPLNTAILTPLYRAVTTETVRVVSAPSQPAEAQAKSLR